MPKPIKMGWAHNLIEPGAHVDVFDNWIAALKGRWEPVLHETFGLYKQSPPFPQLKDLDILYLKIRSPASAYKDWYMFPKWIRESYPDLPIILDASWEEHVPVSNDYAGVVNCATVWAVMCYESQRVQKADARVKIPVRMIGYACPLDMGSENYSRCLKHPALPFGKRKKILAFCRHARPELKDDDKLAIARALPYRARYFDGYWRSSSPEYRGIKNIEYLPRMPWREYMISLSECWVALDNYYPSISRLSIEAGNMKIPMVATNTVTGACIANPSLVCNPHDINCQIEKIRRLFEDEEYYKKEARETYRRLRRYFSLKGMHRRWMRMLKATKILEMVDTK